MQVFEKDKKYKFSKKVYIEQMRKLFGDVPKEELLTIGNFKWIDDINHKEVRALDLFNGEITHEGITYQISSHWCIEKK